MSNDNVPTTVSTTSSNRTNRFALGGFFGIVGVAFLIAVALGRARSRAIPGDPGPWMMPVVLATLLILGGAFLLIQEFKAKSQDSPAPDIDSTALPRQLALLIGVVLFVVGLQWFGFLITTPVFVFGMLWRLKIVWWKALIAAIVLTAVGQLVFVVGFKTPLPTGFWN